MKAEGRVKWVTPLIFNDEPLKGYEKAYFQFDAYADTFVRLIAAKSTRTPLTIGIFGEWGSGKTTLMQLIKARLEETEKFTHPKAKFSFLTFSERDEFRRCRTIWFNAWKYSSQPEGTMVVLIEAILRKMHQDGFINKIKAFLEDPKQAKLNTDKALLSILSKIVTFGKVDLSNFTEESRFKKHLPFLEEFQTSFDRLLFLYLGHKVKEGIGFKIDKIEQLEAIDQENILVIFIDDLDCCLPAKTVQVLEAIKLMIGRPGTVFVLGASERIVQEAIHTHYKQVEKIERGEADCQQYLEKIIQVRFPLPPLRQDDITQFIDELLKNRPEEDVEILRQNLPLMAVGVPTNPRRIKTFVNFVELHWTLLVNSGQDSGLTKDILTRWLVMDAAEPEFTKFVRELAPTISLDEQTIDARLSFVQNAIRLAKGEKIDTAPDYERWPKERYRRLWNLLGQKEFSFDLNPGDLDRMIHLNAPPVHAIPEEKLTPTEPEAQAIRPSITLTEERAIKKEWGEQGIITFVRIPEGPFLMGSNKKQDPYVYDSELPQHLEKSITKPYLISKYPVTNAHFKTFVEAGGYSESSFWHEAQVAKIWIDGKIEGIQDDRPRDKPFDYGEPFNVPNHPMVGITWYEALAFTRWLTRQLEKDDLKWVIDGEAGIDLKMECETQKLIIRLPTEAEWEKAARGEDGRIWPWGNKFDPAKCNSAESGRGGTTPVGIYSPHGDSPYGVSDMAGNVCEWCATKWQDSYKSYENDNSPGGSSPRVLRGGSFGNFAGYVRCAFRSRHYPVNSLRDFGFRVVLSPL